ncbi:DUF3080 family protein [Alteromonas sp. C1M14]|uniref:DUF3080 family protein n=1 Tax=Alteromonas sp. C1M14 TaxID=2841567 RepID=UPI001C09FB0B|nr:DUF3080 family protein [Alteromonas sp. C1M14]MBU2978946.1 DUF3080 domain-containing protein [Alteromonas sp. C1M14]
MHSQRPFPQLISWLLLFSALILTGCVFSLSVDDDLDEYATRLSRVLDTPLTMPSPLPPHAYPARQTLINNIDSITIDLNDFYALRSCQLSTLVAERNTGLGKQQQEAARWAYETDVINALDNCAQQLSNKQSDLAEQMGIWRQQKLDQRHAMWANLIQLSEETRLAFSQSPHLLKAQNNPDARASITALSYLSTLPDAPLPDGKERFSLHELNNQLKIISSARLPAKIWRTQRLLTQGLSSLTAQLRAPLAGLSCPDGRASEQAEIVRNVFYLFFIEKIQPVASVLNQYHYQLQPIWHTLLSSPDIAPTFKQYIKANTEDDFRAYEHAIREHVALWQDTLRRCNLSPQKSG